MSAITVKKATHEAALNYFWEVDEGVWLRVFAFNREHSEIHGNPQVYGFQTIVDGNVGFNKTAMISFVTLDWFNGKRAAFIPPVA